MITIWVPKRLVEVDLYNVAARSPQALAQLSESSYARRVQYAAQKVRGSGAKIVMLTGPSASGKTTSAHCLAKALVQQGTPAQVFPQVQKLKGLGLDTPQATELVYLLNRAGAGLATDILDADACIDALAGRLHKMKANR